MAKEKYSRFDIDRDRPTELALKPVSRFDVDKEEEIELPESYPEAIWEQAKNAPESAWNVAKDFASAAWSPLDTMGSVLEVGESLVNKGARNVTELMTGRDIEPLPHRSEIPADLMIDHYKGRYGSLKDAANTLITDPFGAGLDIFPFAPKFAKAADVVGMAGQGAQRGIQASNLAERVYGHGTTVPQTHPRRSEILQGGMSTGIGTGMRGVKRIDFIKDAIGTKMNETIMAAEKNGALVPKAQLNRYLDDLISDNELIMDAPDLRALKNMKKEFNAQFKGLDTLTPSQAQAWKKARYEKAYAGAADPSELVAKGAATKGQRQQGRGAREALEAEMPELAGMNSAWATMAELRPFIANRIEQVGKTDMGLAKMMRSVFANPKRSGFWGKALDKFARNDMTWVNANLNSHEIRTLMAFTGRTDEMLEEKTEQVPIQ